VTREKVIYVKGISEISRTSSELQCRVTAVTTRAADMHGIFRFYIQDGHHMVGWRPDA
jgi:hypothetical protein